MSVRIREEQKCKYEHASERRYKGPFVIANMCEWEMSKQNTGGSGQRKQCGPIYGEKRREVDIRSSIKRRRSWT